MQIIARNLLTPAARAAGFVTISDEGRAWAGMGYFAHYPGRSRGRILSTLALPLSLESPPLI
jgi:hypothetical protein